MQYYRSNNSDIHICEQKKPTQADKICAKTTLLSKSVASDGCTLNRKFTRMLFILKFTDSDDQH